MPPIALQDDVLFYGDNLDILRRHVPDESIDLIYLDPPFNSQADYNVLFKEESGEQSAAQIRAFSDFWHWDSAARKTHEYLVGNEVNNRVATAADSLYRLLGRNDMSAYLFMMTTRLLELHRVLKPSGSLYLHCDPTASHYLRVVLDAIFDVRNFQNEIIWKRTSAHSGEGKVHRYGAIHDTLLFYSKTKNFKFNPQYADYDKEYEEKFYKNLDPDGRRWMSDNLTAAGVRHGESGKPWRGIDPSKKGYHWKFTVSRLDELVKEGKIKIPKKEGGVPRYKRYRDQVKGVLLQDIWTDLPPLSAHSAERLGYPTQKPSSLLERIILASTNEGDWVLDPFCGCGTAIDAAEKLNRNWVGIDITYLAVNIMKSRMHDAYPHARFRIEGEPQELSAAKELAKDRYQFQWWALSLIGARPVGASSGSREGRKGADEGIDGWLRFGDGHGSVERIVVQVKSGHVSVRDIRELRDVVSRQKAAMGIFITLEDPTSEMVKEVKATEPFRDPTWQHEYPRLQIMTVDDLLKGKTPDIPPTLGPFQEAPISKKAAEGKNDTLL